MQDNFIWTLTTWIGPLLLCVIFHEVAHGWMALKLGDRTALMMGRLTLNPKEHVDPVGSLLVPGLLLLSHSGFLFGWAKPVPIDYRNLKRPKRDMGLVALAGPLANVLLAFAAAIVAALFGRMATATPASLWVMRNLMNIITLSTALAVFNLFPLLPLDGGRIVVSLLPLKQSIAFQKTEPYGLYILIALLFILPRIGIDLIGWFMGLIVPIIFGPIQALLQ